MIKKHLSVAETFYSIQCEGVTTGIPAVFLRLGGCNLLCKSESWVCDTIEVWKKGRAFNFENVLKQEYVEKLKEGAHLVITGGEPLLQQDAIVDYLNWFRLQYHFTPFLEIETNGTIAPSDIMMLKIDQWNVSPKLPNSGEPYEKRVNAIAMRCIKELGHSVMFKFVIRHEEDLMPMYEEYVDAGLVDKERIVLMPAGDSQSDLLRVRLDVVDMCKRFGFRFSDRLHIMLWNQKTGV